MADKLNDHKIQGKKIICTYPKPCPDEFSQLLEGVGAKVFFMPAIEIRPITFQLLKEACCYSWIIFTSKNGVRHFFEKCNNQRYGKIAVLGAATATELRKFNIQPAYVGAGKSGEDFAHELREVISPGESILLVLGKLAPDSIQTALSTVNSVDRIDVYQTVVPEQFDPESFKLINSNSYDLMIVTSPSAVKNLYLAFLSENIDWRIISIGKTTTAACRDLGIEPLATATESSYSGLAQTTIEYLQHLNTRL